MREEIIIAGFGGQGIVFAAELLAWTAMSQAFQATMITSYGAETRGGTSNARVVFSDNEIHSPFVEHPNTLMALNNPSFQSFEKTVKPEGLLIVNQSLVSKETERSDLAVIRIPANDMIKNLGEPELTNMLATMAIVGKYVKHRRVLNWEALLAGLEKLLAKKEKLELMEINIKALEIGATA